jgi:hypothetical protein
LRRFAPFQPLRNLIAIKKNFFEVRAIAAVICIGFSKRRSGSVYLSSIIP